MPTEFFTHDLQAAGPQGINTESGLNTAQFGLLVASVQKSKCNYSFSGINLGFLPAPVCDVLSGIKNVVSGKNILLEMK